MYKSHIALEVRMLLQTGTKTFCSCAYPLNSDPGSNKVPESCPICREEPGAMPQLNPEAAAKAYLVANALACTLISAPVYERNVATPDMPPEYSLSRLSLRIGIKGAMEIVFHGRRKHINIAELRIEEDAGRLTHSANQTRMDYSTAGMPSLRIKTESDFEIGEEAEVFLSSLRRRIQYLEIISGYPVESAMRCNAHVGIAVFPEKPASYVKLRNLNSFNFVRKAINAELNRQEEIVTNGGTVVAESRVWNETQNTAESFQKRRAEAKARFIPVAGLKPYAPPSEFTTNPRIDAVELPEARRDRLANAYSLTQAQADFICDEKSRADYYEQTLAYGADPKETAVWLMSFLMKELKRRQLSLTASAITPERFAALLSMLSQRRVHGGIAKKAIAVALEENRDPLEIIAERDWEQLTDRNAIELLVRAVIEANPKEVQRVRDGDARPIRFLTGRIMRETNNLAEPSLVKEILRDQLSVSLVYVLSLGGAISGRRAEDGTVEAGDERVLRGLLKDGRTDVDSAFARVRFESIQVGRILSEEIVPADWAALIAAVADKLNSGTANGIVIGHGTDTLPFTASLLYWLFADADAPIVFAASSAPPGADSKAEETMKAAVALAVEKTNGVYVVHDGRILSPLNLKFERIGAGGFRNWNMKTAIHTGGSLLTGPLEADQYVFTQLLEEAVNSLCVVRLYPGLRADFLISLMDQGARNFFLELYDTGTASFREGPYSLKKAFSVGRRKGARFYCSSQQEATVDFAGYSSSRALWREGAIPMGGLTTESAVARFLAASIIADSEEERSALVELSANDQ